jgi:hypothetical protein
MAGLVPAIGRGTVPLLMVGTRPAMTVKAGFFQGGSADGRCELAMTGHTTMSAFTRLPSQAPHSI